MKIKNILKQIGFILIIVIIATIIDYIVHSSKPSFYVPTEYYINKVIYATIWGFLGLAVIRNWIISPAKLAVGMSAIIAIVLQTKYFLQGYNLFFVFLFMFLHFIMFLIPSIIIFRKYPDLFVKKIK